MKPIAICHVIYRLDYGGLENGLVNLINRLPSDQFAHVIITLAGASDFRERLPAGVEVIDVAKKPGTDLMVFFRLWRCFRRLRPAIVHTRNLSTLESQLPAMLAGVKRRIHGEHGRDMHDLDNKSSKYRWLRRLFSLIVGQYLVVSGELESYLVDEVGIKPERVQRICNGVDTEKFRPENKSVALIDTPLHSNSSRPLIFGSVGRMQSVKDHATFANAFVQLVRAYPDAAENWRLAIIGDGPTRASVSRILEEAAIEHLAWLPGSRDDIPALLNCFDVFVLPSLAEGISNTILEAMACGLPIVATDVGGNSELIVDGETGLLVPRADPEAMSTAMASYALDAERRKSHGASGRHRACDVLSLNRMVDAYSHVYHQVAA